jgi:hypothetical protein
MACFRREKCQLYPQFKSQFILRIFQHTYCETDSAWERCVRHLSASRGVVPSPRLLPNGDSLPDPPPG